jgi:hypothetical protein
MQFQGEEFALPEIDVMTSYHNLRRLIVDVLLRTKSW